MSLLLSAAPCFAAVDFEQLYLSAEELKSSDPQQFREILNELNLSIDSLDSVQQKKLSYLNAYSLSFSGQLKEGIEEYIKVVDGPLTDPVQIKAAVSIVNNSALAEQWETGLIYANWLLENLELVKDNALLEKIYFTIAYLYNNLGQYESALVYSENLLGLATTPRGKCAGYIAHLESIQRLGLMKQNLHKVQNGIDVCQSTGEFLGVALIKLHWAEYLSTTDSPQLAIEQLEEPLEQLRKINYVAALDTYYSTLAKAYFASGDLNQAQRYAELVTTSKGFVDYKLPSVNALEVLYKIARQKGDYQTALEYHEKHASSQKAYWDSVRVREIAVQRVNLETLEKSNEIALLNQQNSLLRTQNALSKQQAQNNRLALALSSVLLILLFVWLYRSRRIQLKLRKMAQTDELTGINNRHFFNEVAKQHLQQAKNQQKALCFVLFDLDFFKRINDQFGHQVGDWALKKAVLEAHKVCRSIDVIGRMGGEEFAILLPGCEIEEGLRVAEICRTAIERITSDPTGHQFKVTASFGVADAKSCGYDLDKLFAGADAALYYSKEHGRNKVYRYNQEKMAMG